MVSLIDTRPLQGYTVEELIVENQRFTLIDSEKIESQKGYFYLLSHA